MQSNNNGPVGSKPRENAEAQRGRNFTIPQPIAEEDQHQPQSEADKSEDQGSTAAAFIDSVKKFFAPCVGAVDAASVYIGECRPSNYDGCDPIQHDNVAEDVIMRLRERSAGYNQGKRRSDTLEIPTNGMLFDDDDVSAISSHTLEEMERLRLAQSSGLTNFQLSPGKLKGNVKPSNSNILHPLPTGKTKRPQDTANRAAASNDQSWRIKPESSKPTDATGNLILCASASDSSSSEGADQGKGNVQSAYKSPPAWSNKAGKEKEFKTHPVG
mmetsp:Transcript_1117/g.2382  ORF Transcript_1117/g.2382 Transcript_1117/m.2382 type:complete len:271 (+) Transcript_1117:117-929(+)